MTSIEWLANKLSITFNTMYADEIEQSKEMHKQEIKDDSQRIIGEHKIQILVISDEEIDKGAKECFENKGKSIFWDYNTMPSFIEGAKWYREQLKLKK
jgi:hypothetical protein